MSMLQLDIRDVGGHRGSIVVPQNADVADVKKIVQDVTRVPSEAQRLFLGERELCVPMVVSDVWDRRASTLFVIHGAAPVSVGEVQNVRPDEALDIMEDFPESPDLEPDGVAGIGSSDFATLDVSTSASVCVEQTHPVQSPQGSRRSKSRESRSSVRTFGSAISTSSITSMLRTSTSTSTTNSGDSECKKQRGRLSFFHQRYDESHRCLTRALRHGFRHN